jgi:hypothetical protein
MFMYYVVQLPAPGMLWSSADLPGIPLALQRLAWDEAHRIGSTLVCGIANAAGIE